MVLAWATDRWRRLVPGSPRIDQIRYYDEHAAVPERLPRHQLALIGGGEQTPRWAAFECPCGTGHRIMVPLGNGRRWRLDREPGLSLHPSIDSVTGRRCHFWLRDGRVRWSPTRRLGRRGALPRAS